MKRVLLISFDAVGSDELPILKKLPHFGALCQHGKVFDQMKTVFTSNTYPIHTSISTGTVPGVHGVISNTVPNAKLDNSNWCYDARKIQGETLWQFAKKRSLKTAAVFWPVTGYAKEIDYNIPEAMARPDQNQMIVSLKTGSKLLQIKEFLRHGKLMDGIDQPQLDNFSVSCMCDILREKSVQFAMMHLTCYDTLCHHHGRGSQKAIWALGHLDESLGKLMKAAGADTRVIVFSDHAQLNVHSFIDLNQLLAPTDGSFFHDAGGSSFCYRGNLSDEQLYMLSQAALAVPGVHRLLSTNELVESGFSGKGFGVCAKEGHYFIANHSEKAGHGYPTDYPNYETFCCVNDSQCSTQLHSILDINTLVKSELEKVRVTK